MKCHMTLPQAPDCEPADGNITEARPRHVLRQASYESRATERYSTNWTEDLAATMAISRAEDVTSKVLKGGIHLIGKTPLIVHLYREHSLVNISYGSDNAPHGCHGFCYSPRVGEKWPHLMSYPQYP